MNQKAFIEQAYRAALRAKANGAPISAVIATAQAALESGFGTSELAVKANNLKGVKAGGSWHGDVLTLPTREWSKERGWYNTVAKWRKYRDWEHAFADYGKLIANLPWFQDAAAVCNDPRAFLEALVNPDEPVYATDPLYVEKVWRIVEQYDLLDSAPTSDDSISIRLDKADDNRVTQVFVGGMPLDFEAVGLVPQGNGTAKLFIR